MGLGRAQRASSSTPFLRVFDLNVSSTSLSTSSSQTGPAHSLNIRMRRAQLLSRALHKRQIHRCILVSSRSRALPRTWVRTQHLPHLVFHLDMDKSTTLPPFKETISCSALGPSTVAFCPPWRAGPSASLPLLYAPERCPRSQQPHPALLGSGKRTACLVLLTISAPESLPAIALLTSASCQAGVGRRPSNTMAPMIRHAQGL